MSGTSDPNVYRYLLFSSQSAAQNPPANACYLQFQAATQTLSLAADSGYFGGGGLGNSQCSVALTGSNVTATGISVTVSVNFTCGFAAAGSPKYVFMNLFDNNYQLYPQAQGAWTVQVPIPISPAGPVTLQARQTQVFTANQSVTWSVGTGTVSPASGTSTTYTAPESVTVATSTTLTATAGSSSGQVQINLNPRVSR